MTQKGNGSPAPAKLALTPNQCAFLGFPAGTVIDVLLVKESPQTKDDKGNSIPRSNIGLTCGGGNAGKVFGPARVRLSVKSANGAAPEANGEYV